MFDFLFLTRLIDRRTFSFNRYVRDRFKFNKWMLLGGGPSITSLTVNRLDLFNNSSAASK